jgi:hypothetical protein
MVGELFLCTAPSLMSRESVLGVHVNPGRGGKIRNSIALIIAEGSIPALNLGLRRQAHKKIQFVGGGQ